MRATLALAVGLSAAIVLPGCGAGGSGGAGGGESAGGGNGAAGRSGPNETIAELARGVQRQLAAVATSAPANAVKDGLIAAAVKTRLGTIDPDSASTVDVSVHDGHVVLTGKVVSQRERAQFVQAAKNGEGVVSVTDRLQIDPHRRGIAEQAGDVALAAKVRAALAGQAGLNAFKVSVGAKNGVVTLAGDVPTPAIATTMVQTARGVSGVRAVRNDLRVVGSAAGGSASPPPPPSPGASNGS